MISYTIFPSWVLIKRSLPELAVRGLLLLLFTTLFTLFALRYLPYSGDGDWVANKVAARGKIVMHAPLTSLIHLA
ncbi:hypothetical protein GF373_13520, partial [bacterium]|nr:hypothetical protein [bacterium]